MPGLACICDTGSGLHGMLLAGAAGSQPPSGLAYGQRVQGLQHAVLLCSDHIGLPRDWEIGIGIAALRPDHGTPDVHRSPRSQQVGWIMIIAADSCDHLPSQRHGQLDHVRRPAAGKHFDRFRDLQGVSGSEAQAEPTYR